MVDTNTRQGKRTPVTLKIKFKSETLEQFIEYAYGRKGQPLTLKSKVEKQIAQNARLDDAALSRLLHLVMIDILTTAVALRLPGELRPMLQEIKKNLRAKRYARPE